MRILHLLFFAVAAVAMFSSTAIPVYASETDSRIESSARQTYVFKTYLLNDDIKIHSKDGAVTLTGIVADESHKGLAQETMVGLPGVTHVDNRLEIKGAPPSANSDAWLRDKVKITLLFHSSISSGRIEVDVRDGIATLRGDANSFAQKQLATEYTMDVDGIKQVKNEMTVITTPLKKRTVGEKIDDASITAQVKMALLYHRSTSAVKTSVTTKNGIVTMSGKASNADEIKLATKLASDVIGVNSVKNQMTIESP